MKGVFITGATGSVGSRVLKEYLEKTDYFLYLLVRGNSDLHAQERVQQILDFWELPSDASWKRIQVVRGDITEKDLGLMATEIKELQSKVHLFVHAASEIRLDMSEEKARSLILGGTKNAFFLSQNLKSVGRFGFVSTMEIIGKYEGFVKEEFLHNYPLEFLNTYELAKFEAEEFLREQIQNGYEVTVFRPSMVVGESNTGKTLGFQSFYLAMEKMLLKPDFSILPKGPPIDTIPVDILAGGIVSLMDLLAAKNQVYHFSQGIEDKISFFDFIDRLKEEVEGQTQKIFPKPRFISPLIHYSLFKVLSCLSFGKFRRFCKIQLLFLKFSFVSWQFDNSKTKKTMEELGIAWPSFRQYFPVLIKYYLPLRTHKNLPF